MISTLSKKRVKRISRVIIDTAERDIIKNVASFDSVVYVLFNGTDYKIGYTSNLADRYFNSSHAANPGVKLVHAFECSLNGETWLHTLFARSQVNGEWFSLTPKEAEWLCSIINENDMRNASGRDLAWLLSPSGRFEVVSKIESIVLERLTNEQLFHIMTIATGGSLDNAGSSLWWYSLSAIERDAVIKALWESEGKP